MKNMRNFINSNIWEVKCYMKLKIKSIPVSGQCQSGPTLQGEFHTLSFLNLLTLGNVMLLCSTIS